MGLGFEVARQHCPRRQRGYSRAYCFHLSQPSLCLDDLAVEEAFVTAAGADDEQVEEEADTLQRMSIRRSQNLERNTETNQVVGVQVPLHVVGVQIQADTIGSDVELSGSRHLEVSEAMRHATRGGAIQDSNGAEPSPGLRSSVDSNIDRTRIESALMRV